MIYIAEIILLIYCVYFVSYTFVFVLAGLLYRRKTLNESNSYHDIAILVPAYRCDEVILNAVKKNREVEYPREHWKMFVISDGLKEATNLLLEKEPIEVIKVHFEQSTKVKSLKKCLEEKSIDKYDSIVILDADNIMDPKFLKFINQELNVSDAIQGCRTGANKNNSLAILDGVSEAINTMVFRQGAYVLNLSVSLSGSGMAFKKSIFESVIGDMDSVGGFDRELEYRLLEKGTKSVYLKEAVVLDEKTDEMSNFQNQRRRWVSSHFHYLAKYFRSGISGFLSGRFSYFHSTVLRNLQLPRSMNIGLITLFTILSFLLAKIGYWHWQVWITLWMVHTVLLFLSIPRAYYTKELFISIIKLPGIIFRLFLLLFKLKGANKQFIHTIHKSRK